MQQLVHLKLGKLAVSPEPVPGLVTAGAKPLRMGPSRAAIADLDGLPHVDRSLIDMRAYTRHIGESMVHGVISLLATRGCPYSCSYCHRIMSKKLHWRSPDNIFDEVQAYYDLGFRRFAFVDDIFNLRRDVSHAFYQKVIARGMKVQILFPNGLRGDVLNHEDIDLMVEAGVVNFALALETASPRLQGAIRKNLHLDKLSANIDYITGKYAREVMLDLFIMMGFPSETKEELQMTFDFVKSIRWLHFPVVSLVQIYPGSEMVQFAIENGVTMDQIERSAGREYHDAPETLPWPKHFAKGKQVEFYRDYFLNRERLLHVLPIQMRHMREEELVQKYNSCLPEHITDFDGLLRTLRIDRAELQGAQCAEGWLPPESAYDIIASRARPVHEEADSESPPLRLLLVDLSTLYTSEQRGVYSVLDQPLGMLYLLTNVYKLMGHRVEGLIAKSAVDFDSNEQLREIIEKFQPDVIGVRTLSCYKSFFHRAIADMRTVTKAPMIAGGPYLSSDYLWALDDENIDVGVIGEGEYAIVEILEGMWRHGKRLPPVDELAAIPGVVVRETAVPASVAPVATAPAMS
jgi:radical SAM superfamily enzyme YgiQ (UPF0313 family)